jgi:hypothetical protein
MADNFVIGNQTQIYFGILPNDSLTAAVVAAPPNVTITTSSVANSGTATIAVSALSGGVPAGTPLAFAPVVTVTLSSQATAAATSLACSALSAGIPAGSLIYFQTGSIIAKTTAVANSAAVSISVEPLSATIASGQVGYYFSATPTIAYTTASANTGATGLVVETLSATIASGSVALHRGLILLIGGTTSEEQIQSNDTETNIYGTGLNYATGKVTGASWSISYSFNVLPSDPGYFRMAYAATNAISGIRGWVKKVDPAPAGSTTGDTIEGTCDVTDFNKSNPADGIITGQCTFRGRGKPTLSHYA